MSSSKLLIAKLFLLFAILLYLMACPSREQRTKTLVTQLGATKTARRTEAAEALIRIGPDAIEALIQGISDKNDQVRAMSAWTLGEIATPTGRVVPALISMFADADENVRFVASNAVQNLGEPAVPYLINALTAKLAKIRCAAAHVLGEIGTPLDRVVPALINTLTDPDWNVRRFVVHALVAIGPSAVNPLTEALNSDDPLLCQMAERVLNDIGTPQARQSIADVKGRFLSDR